MQHLSLSQLDSLAYTAHADGFLIACAGREANTIDYSQPKEMIRANEKRLVAQLTGLDPSCVFFLEQEHSDAIVEITTPDANDRYCIATADALITNTPGRALVIRTADCVPVMIFDPVTHSAAAIHSGWKSTEKEISAKAARLLHERYGAACNDLRAYLLPYICGMSYTVGREVADRFPLSVQSHGNELVLDLGDAIRRSLLKTGMREENIFTCNIDTRTDNARFFSHRAGNIQRNLNVMVIHE